MAEVSICLDPVITPAQLYDFYVRNDICEAGYSEARAAEVLRHPSIIVAAFAGDRLVAIARALTDGLAAVIMEVSVDLAFQGPTKLGNGSVIEGDEAGLGKRVAKTLLDELAARNVDFISMDIVEGYEEPFFESLGFSHNTGMRMFTIDKRPYVRRPAVSAP